MPARNITDSANIASLDFAAVGDLCDGVFSLDLSPSIWIGSGASNVLGASFKITNPYNVVVRNFTTSGYDIYPPMTGEVVFNIPTQANNFQYGTYTIEVALTDANGTIYNLSKPVKICAPNPKNKNVKYGSLSATLDGNCVSGKIAVIADTVPTYQGNISDSQVNDFSLEYPTSSGLDVLETEIGSFSATLFEGVYKFTGTICAHYPLGDNIYANVNYRVKKEKNIRCLLDKGCVAARLAELQNQITEDCTDAEKLYTQSVIIDALLLLQVIDGLINDGQDASDYIGKLESLLGCICTCNCADGTPIINSNPTGDFAIQGCGFDVEQVDLTTVYTLYNYRYVVEVPPNGNALTITTSTLDNCTQTQTLTFNIGVVYSQIKNASTSGTEYNFWASIVNKSWNDLDIDCVGVTQLQWDAFTYAQRTQAILDSLCAGNSCDAQITADTVSNSAADVTVSWNNISGVYQVAAYLDGVLAGTVLSPIESFKYIGAADGDAHTWTLVAKCTNGSIGNSLNGSFTYIGCPLILNPVLTESRVTDADCPYDLTTLVGTLPAGIIAEWHTAYNTNTSTLVDDPTMVSSGNYWAYAKDSNECYSPLAAHVTIICSVSSGCSAPQSILVEAITGGNRVRFQSAAFPPPDNSYTVKRRLASDPDIDASYTTIGTPTYNSGASRWEIFDASAVNNTLYRYRAISNCTSTAPYADYQFANIDCSTVSFTPNETSIAYSFSNVGGSVDKYEVSIYSLDGITLIHKNTHLPAFPSPITGTFIYLSAGITYKVRVRAYIGPYFIDCGFVSVATIAYNYTLSASYGYSIDTVAGAGVPSPTVPYTGSNGTAYGHHTAMAGSYTIGINGSAVPNTSMRSIVNGTQQDCVNISAGTGSYPLNISASESDTVRITIVLGVC